MSGGWNTIESDAGVFTYLVEKLGVQDVQFEELLTLEPDYLKQLSPLYGVIFLFKYPTEQKSEQSTTNSKPPDGTFDHIAAENNFFAAQVIQNACGTQALLSVLLNKDNVSSPQQGIELGHHLREFKDFTLSFPSDLRGEALSNSELIRDVHNSFARSSPFVDETSRMATEDDDVYHFIAYTSINDTLYELDGLQPAPISHGPCKTGDSSEFADKIIPVLQRRIERYPPNEIRFNLLAMTRDLRNTARERQDYEMLEREEAKRRDWLWENALRRHNFLGFTKEILKGVVGMKLKEGGKEGYDKWVDDAKKEAQRKLEMRKAGKGGMEMDVG